jgi:hypothetical protein
MVKGTLQLAFASSQGEVELENSFYFIEKRKKKEASQFLVKIPPKCLTWR